MDQQQDTTVCYLQITQFKITCRVNINGYRRIHHANTSQKKAVITALISQVANSTARIVIKDEEEHYIIIKGSFLSRTDSIAERNR